MGFLDQEAIDLMLVKSLLKIDRNLIKDIGDKNSHLTLKETQDASFKLILALFIIRTAEDLRLIHLPHENQWEQFSWVDTIKNEFQNFSSVGKFSLKIDFLPENIAITNSLLGNIINELQQFRFNQIHMDVLGQVYEGHLSENSTTPPNQKSKPTLMVSKKRLGIYYTYPFVIHYIVSRLFNSKDYTPEEISKLKIIDLSCGSGSFLLGSLKVLSEKMQNLRCNQKTDSPILQKLDYLGEFMKNLSGVDLDPIAVNIASVNLFLRALFLFNARDIPKVPNIMIGNALILEGLANQSFDIVMGNPPYIKGDNILNEEHETILKEKFADIYNAEADYSYYFLHRGISLLKEGGKLAFIISRYFLKAFYGKKLREFILQHCKILEIVDLGNIDVFRNIGTRCCLLFLEKTTSPKEQHEIRIIRYTARKIKGSKVKIFSWISEIDAQLQSNRFVKTPFFEGYFIPQKSLHGDPWLFTPAMVSDLYYKVKSQFPSMISQGFQIGEGGICGAKDVFCISETQFKELRLEKELWVANVKTEDLDRYFISPPDSFIFYGDHIEDFKEFASFPQTEKYLLDHFVELAFERKEFGLKGGVMNHQEKGWLKEFLKNKYLDKSYSFDDFAQSFEARVNPGKNQDNHEMQTIINHFIQKVLQLPFITQQNDKTIVDFSRSSFHNFWQWWKWTRPQNIALFQNPKILTPYISKMNKFMLEEMPRFSVSAAINALAFPGEAKNPPWLFLLGLFNSRLYTFLHQQRAKSKDYRYEYFVESLKELPYPDTISNNLQDLITEKVTALLTLNRNRREQENKFHTFSSAPILTHDVAFQEIWDCLAEFQLEGKNSLEEDFQVNSVAFRVRLSEGNQFTEQLLMDFFNENTLQWEKILAIINNQANRNPLLTFLFYGIHDFLQINQIDARSKWRRGLVYSEIAMQHITFPIPRNISLNRFLHKDVSEIMNVMNNSFTLPLNQVLSHLFALEEEIDEAIYKIFHISREEQQIIENFIKVDIPYLP